MASVSDWKVPASVQPKPEDYGYDLEAALSAVVGVRAIIPSDAFTAETLGTERAGNGVLIRADGLVLTIGYLVTEAETIWLSLIDGRAVPGTVLAYDQTTGFGLIQALARLDLPALPIGSSSAVSVGERVVVGGAGGRQKSVAARIVAKQEFAGYWEYVIDEAIFTAPSHPNWGGTALIGPRGELIGIGSLQLQEGREQGPPGDINMIVPIDLLEPIMDDLMTLGRPKAPPRSRTAWWWSELPRTGRRRKRICAPATCCSRSRAPRSAILPGFIARCGRSARPASRFRCRSTATARRSRRV
jgi:S1-C subfamily serine protease